MEIWKCVVGAEDHYIVSNYGRIKNKHTDCILKPSKSGCYYHVELRYGINKHLLVHRIVAEAFIPNPSNFPQVNHIDEDKHNNNATNLEWCDSKYNNNYGYGSLARNQKIQQLDLDGNLIKTWDSLKEASENLGLLYQGISACCRKKRITCGGFKWRYLDNTKLKRWKNKNVTI